MQQRLLDGYLAGGLEKDVFTAKNTELKIEADRLRERLADAAGPSGELGRRVKEAFEFSQNAADQWTVSGVTDRRAILTRTLLKRCLSATSLVTKKRRPFDVLTEGPILDESRSNETPIELFVGGVASLNFHILLNLMPDPRRSDTLDLR